MEENNYTVENLVKVYNDIILAGAGYDDYGTHNIPNAIKGCALFYRIAYKIIKNKS